MKKLKQFASDETGTTAIEYALIASLIGVALIPAANYLGVSLNGVYNSIAAALTL